MDPRQRADVLVLELKDRLRKLGAHDLSPPDRPGVREVVRDCARMLKEVYLVENRERLEELERLPPDKTPEQEERTRLIGEAISRGRIAAGSRCMGFERDDGVVYPSVAEAALAIGCSVTTVYKVAGSGLPFRGHVYRKIAGRRGKAPRRNPSSGPKSDGDR